MPRITGLVLSLGLLFVAGCQTTNRSTAPAGVTSAAPPHAEVLKAQTVQPATVAGAPVAGGLTVFQSGVAAEAGSHGWFATSWTTDEGNGFKGKPTHAPSKSIIIRHQFYTVCYDPTQRIPIWAAYTIDANAKAIADSGTRSNSTPGFARPSTFAVETLVSTSAASTGQGYAKHTDYSDAIDPRYTVDPTLTVAQAVPKPEIIQRGHVVPNEAMKLKGDATQGMQSMRDCFSMENIVPESNSFNAPTWAALESALLNWAVSYGRVWVICGPVITSKPAIRMVGRVKKEDRGIVVPDQMFCVIIAKVDGTLHTGAFILPNIPQNFSYTAYVKSVDDVEALTGLNFLPDISEPAAVEKENGGWLLNHPD